MGVQLGTLLSTKLLLEIDQFSNLQWINSFWFSRQNLQRLPRKSTSEPPSLCVTPYPTPNAEYAEIRNEIVEKEFEMAQKIISVVRSTRSDYNLPNKIK